MTALPASELLSTPAHGAWVTTYTGLVFDLICPDPQNVAEEDVIVPLSMQSHFGGRVTRHYSVAQHSLAVAALLEQMGFDPVTVLQGLLHDAAAAYVVEPPCKHLLAEYQTIADRVWLAVAARFQVPVRLHPAVRWCHEQVEMHETHALLPGGPAVWGSVAPQTEAPDVVGLTMTPEEAQTAFAFRLSALHLQIAATA